MTSTLRAVLLVGVLGLVAGRAEAQAITPAEREYGAALARSLESTHGSEVVRFAPVDGVDVLRVILGGLRVERVDFASPEQAQEHLVRLLDAARGDPVVGELRGARLVLVRGARVKDAAFARRALAAAAGDEGEVEASFALVDGALTLTTRLASGPVRARADEALVAARTPGRE